MGWGDEIMVSGLARRAQQKSPLPVRVVDGKGRTRWSGIWENNPRFAPEGFQGRVQTLVNAPGKREYIAGKTREGWKWREWICPLGEIYLTSEERAFGREHRGTILLEPSLKPEASPNKDWGWERWAELARRLGREGHVVTQFASRHRPVLPGARVVRAKNFRHACAVVASARLAVLPEGGLHHAAAAFGTATIVIFGGFISPAQTGYAHHLNLFTGGEPCGRRARCAHCARAMARISVKEVLGHALSLLRCIQLE